MIYSRHSWKNYSKYIQKDIKGRVKTKSNNSSNNFCSSYSDHEIAKLWLLELDPFSGFRAKRFVASIDSIETIKFPAAKERRRCIILENCIVLCRPANGRRAISKTFHWRFPFVGCSLAAVQFSQRKICNRISSVKQNGTGRYTNRTNRR